MTVTFKDVAKLAGVSTQTVSRVTNDSESVSEKTRFKVLDAIEQLGYVPNKAAQALKSNHQIIGVVTLNMSFHGASMIANGVRLRAHELGYTTAIVAIDKVCDQAVEEAVRELIGQKVKAIIVIAPVTGECAEALEHKYHNLDLLFVDVPRQAKVCRVSSANRIGATLAARHLLDLGRKEFLLISGPAESHASNTRLSAWKTELKKDNADISAIYEGDWLAASGYRATNNALTTLHDFDAVLVANDQMALGVLRALHEFGVNVPKDVSVVGFDGTEDSEYFIPPLTTVKQNFVQHGHIAVDQVLHQQEPSDFNDQSLDIELILRESSAPSAEKADTTEQVKALLNQAMRLL